MIVNRRVYDIKPGRRGEAVELLRELETMLREAGFTGAFRIYVGSIGKVNQVAMEAEYESLAAYEKTLAGFGAMPTLSTWGKKWNEIRTGGIIEIWAVPD